MPRPVPTGFRTALAVLLFAAPTATGQVYRVLQEPGATVPVSAVAVSPDGATAAWGGAGKVRIGDARTGKVRAEWAVVAVRLGFTPDGGRLLAWGPTGFAAWDVAAGKESFRTDTPVNDAVPAADPHTAVLANPAGRVWVVDLRTGAERAALQPGTPAVGGVTYSPDGKWIAAGDAAGRVRTWDRATGATGREFGTGGAAVSQLEFTSDGQTLTATRADGTVHLWNAADGALRAEAKGRPRTEWTVAFTPDGNALAFHAPDGSVEVWDLRAARRKTAFTPAEVLRFGSILLAPGGNTLFLSAPVRTETGVFDATTGAEVTRVPRGTGGTDVADGGKAVLVSTEPTGVRLYDAATGKDRGPLDGFTGRSSAASSSPDARWVAAGNNDTACVWDSTTRQLRCRLAGPGRCGYLVFSPDARLLAGKGNGSYGVTLWDGETGRMVATVPARVGSAWGYKFSPDSRELLVGFPDGGLRAYDAGGRLVRAYQRADGLGRLAASPDGSRVAYGSGDGGVTVWEAKGWGAPLRLDAAADAVAGLAFAPDGPDLVVGSRDGAAAVWDVAERRRKFQLAPAGGPPLSPDPAFNPVAFSDDGHAIAAGFGDGRVRVWYAANGRPVSTAAVHTGAVRSVSFDGRAVVSVGADETVRVWDAATGVEREHLRQRFPAARTAPAGPGAVLAGSSSGTLVRIEPGANTVRPLARPPVRADRLLLSPDGSLAVLVDGERAALWPVAGDRPPVRFEPRSAVAAAFAPDGKTVALGTAAGQLELWDAKTLAPVATLVRPVSPVTQAALAPDGSAVAYALQDGTLTLWDAGAGKPRWGTPPPPDRMSARSVAFGDRGRLVVVVRWDGSVRVYDAAAGAEMHGAANAFTAAAHPARPLVAVAGRDGRVTFWAGDGRAPATLTRASTAPPLYAVLCAGGKTLFLQTSTAAELWDVDAGVELVTRPAARSAVSPDGGHVVLRTAQEAVVLDAATGKPVGRPFVRMAASGWVAVGNGGRFAVDHSTAGSVLWESATGKPVPGLPTSLRGAAVAPDGTTVAVSGAGGVSVREYATTPPKVRFADKAGAGVPAFTADGRFLFTTEFGTTRAWESATGKPIPGLPDQSGRTWNPGADRVLLNDREGALRLVALGAGESTLVHPGRPRPVHGLGFTPDGQGLWAVGSAGATRYDLVERRQTRFAPGYFDQSAELTPAPDGGVVIATPGTIWRVPATGDETAEPAAVRLGPTNPPVSADGRWGLVTNPDSWFLVKITEKEVTEAGRLPAGRDAQASIAPTGKFVAAWVPGRRGCRVFTFPGLEEACGLDAPGPTAAVAWAPDASRLAVLTRDGVVRLWSVPSGRFVTAVTVPEAADAAQAGLRFSADGTRLVIGTGTGALAVLDVDPGTERATCRGHTGAVLAAALSPDGSTVYSAAADRTIRAWDARTGRLRTAAPTPGGLALGLAVSPDGRRLASAGADGTVRLWDPARMTELRSWAVPGPVWCVAFAPDGKALAAGCDDGTVRVIPLSRPPWPFDEQSWPEEVEVTPLAGNAGAVFALAFSPDGRTLYAGTGSFDDLAKPGRVLRWEMAARKRGADLGEARGAVLALAVGADRVASGGADGTVTLWDPAGPAPRTLSGHRVAVRGLAFLPGGRLLSAGGRPADPQAVGEVKVWDLATGREVPPLLGQRSGVSAVAATPGGAVVATAGWDELVRVWGFAEPK